MPSVTRQDAFDSRGPLCFARELLIAHAAPGAVSPKIFVDTHEHLQVLARRSAVAASESSSTPRTETQTF